MDERGGGGQTLTQSVIERRDVDTVHQGVVAEDGDREQNAPLGGVVPAPGDAGVAVGGAGDRLDKARVGHPGEGGDEEQAQRLLGALLDAAPGLGLFLGLGGIGEVLEEGLAAV